jgi:cholesterol 7-dehydrogenase
VSSAPLLRSLCCVHRCRQIPRLIVAGMLKGMIIQYERDNHIFNNKRFMTKPLLIREDALILRFRRWFSQFYSESSERMGRERAVGEFEW